MKSRAQAEELALYRDTDSSSNVNRQKSRYRSQDMS